MCKRFLNKSFLGSPISSWLVVAGIFASLTAVLILTVLFVIHFMTIGAWIKLLAIVVTVLFVTSLYNLTHPN